MNRRLLLVFILGFSSGLPMALLSSTLQAWFAASGVSIFATAALSLISLPYMLRVLWSPFVDSYYVHAFGRRRSWILLMQVILLLGFNILAWYNPTDNVCLMSALALVLAFFSATQDIAIDAHRAEYLPIKEHALGASYAVFGYRLALLVASGLALILATHMGWAFTYRLLGFTFLCSIITVLFSQEPPIEPRTKQTHYWAFVMPFKEIISRPKIFWFFMFIFFYKLGEAFTTTTSGIIIPFLIQGLGFSLDTVGYINKLLGITAIVLGGFIAGLILLYHSLYRALFFFGLLQAITNMLFVGLAVVGKNTFLLAIAVFSDNLVAGMGSTALVALCMRFVNQQFTGTQFSLLIGIATIPRIISGPLAAWIQIHLGWIGLYQLSVIFAVLFIPFLLIIKDYTQKNCSS